jgi:hypothetical protein
VLFYISIKPGLGEKRILSICIHRVLRVIFESREEKVTGNWIDVWCYNTRVLFGSHNIVTSRNGINEARKVNMFDTTLSQFRPPPILSVCFRSFLV